MINRAATETKSAISLPGLSSFNSSQRPRARISENKPNVVCPTWIRNALLGSTRYVNVLAAPSHQRLKAQEKRKPSLGAGFG